MATPNRIVGVHSCFFEEKALRVKQVISLLAANNSLSEEDVQAIRELTFIYEELVRHGQGKGALNEANYKTPCREPSVGEWLNP